MEGQKKQIVHGDCPRKLNLSVPLLSTKRHLSVATDTNNLPASRDNALRVPFSWEQLPGQPKDNERNASYLGLDLPPTPKPPPGRKYEPKECVADQYSEYDDGCYGDDDSGEEERDERFADAIDIFSLAESADYAETDFRAKKERSDEANTCPSPNFIIQRFLPDAQALAAESVANKRLPFPSSINSDASFSRGTISINRSYASPKGCGLGSLFPWKIKPKLCSVKTPVCDTIIGANQKRTGDSTS